VLTNPPTTVTTITRHRTPAWLVEHHALRDGEGDLLAERWVVKDNPPKGFPCEVECFTMDEVLDTTAEFEDSHRARQRAYAVEAERIRSGL